MDTDSVLYFLKGVVEKAEAPVGFHDLSQAEITVKLPAGASVERDPGKFGDGTEEYAATSSIPLLSTVLLFIKKAGITGPAVKQMWLDAAREAMASDQDPEDLFPDIALQAMNDLKRELGSITKHRKTRARRAGTKFVTILVNGVPLAAEQNPALQPAE